MSEETKSEMHNEQMKKFEMVSRYLTNQNPHASPQIGARTDLDFGYYRNTAHAKTSHHCAVNHTGK